MNPTTRPTVLARLSWKLSSQPEAVATEALEPLKKPARSL